eukprot:scaffold76884_cov20-Tisochrysis_lutea.AAC.2
MLTDGDARLAWLLLPFAKSACIIPFGKCQHMALPQSPYRLNITKYTSITSYINVLLMHAYMPEALEGVAVQK